MNLVSRLVLNDTFIENIHKEIVKEVLQQRHPTIKITTMRHGTIILNNNKIIKCVHRYYADKNGKPIKAIKSIHACAEYQKALDIDCPNYSCLACHLQCLEKLNNNELQIK